MTDELKTTRLAPTLKPLPWDDVQLSQEVSLALENLAIYIQGLPMSESKKGTCLQAVRSLRENFCAAQINPDHPTMVFYWFIIVNSQFAGSLQDRDPVALIILAHYAVLLYSQRRVWWVGIRGLQLAREVDENLASEFKDFITWPKKMLQL